LEPDRRRAVQVPGLAGQDLYGQEEESGVVQQVSRYKCALPLGTPVTTKNRVALVGGPVYEIQGVDDSNANAVQIILDCKLVH
jgi:hypothetical protein